MKILAIGSFDQPLTDDLKQQIMPKEVTATLKLYLEGKIEQFWFRQDKPGVVFLMNTDSVEQAKSELDALPLTASKMMTFNLMTVGPLAPLGLLIQPR
jgi:hypothetical protein